MNAASVEYELSVAVPEIAGQPGDVVVIQGDRVGVVRFVAGKEPEVWNVDNARYVRGVLRARGTANIFGILPAEDGPWWVVESNPSPKPARGRPRKRPHLVAIAGGVR